MPPILIPSTSKRIATRILEPSQKTTTYSKLATEASEQGVKTVQNSEWRHMNDVNDIVLVLLLLTGNIFYTMF